MIEVRSRLRKLGKSASNVFSNFHKEKGFRDYKVKDSKKSIDDVFFELNSGLYDAYSSDTTLSRGRLEVESVDEYITLLEDIKILPDLNFVDQLDISQGKLCQNKVNINIRHDLDIDIIGAVQQAEIEKSLGIRASWYILHTAHYYGVVKSKCFHRNNAMIKIYKYLQSLGHEIGLHTDPLSLYQDHKIDGLQAVKAELEWLRGHGITIDGVVAHNSRPAYGAGNFEIFDDLITKYAELGWLHFEPAFECTKDGKTAPLRMTSLKELGLKYEGTEYFWRKDLPLEHFCIMSINQWRVLSYEQQRVHLSDNSKTLYHPTSDVIDRLRELEPGSTCILLTHPMYYGGRHKKGVNPTRNFEEKKYVKASSGYQTYVPGSPILNLHRENDRLKQTINFANSKGMLDKETPDISGQKSRHALIVGGDQVNAEHLPLEAQFSWRLQKLCNDKLANNWIIEKLSFSNMGAGPLYHWPKAKSLNKAISPCNHRCRSRGDATIRPPNYRPKLRDI